MPLLSDRDIQIRLAELPNWTLSGQQASGQQTSGQQTSGQQIECTRRFRDFIEAIAFVNQLVEPAEAAGHHPDISISYNKVTIALTTHDAGGLTEKDFELAKAIAQI